MDVNKRYDVDKILKRLETLIDEKVTGHWLLMVIDDAEVKE
jgi:hypothetical protein